MELIIEFSTIYTTHGVTEKHQVSYSSDIEQYQALVTFIRQNAEKLFLTILFTHQSKSEHKYNTPMGPKFYGGSVDISTTIEIFSVQNKNKSDFLEAMKTIKVQIENFIENKKGSSIQLKWDSSSVNIGTIQQWNDTLNIIKRTL